MTADVSPAVQAMLQRQGEKPALRFITCGGVDDGKSTLIGRLLYDSRALLDDQLSSLRSDSRSFGTTGGDIDFALLLDGLQAEREQGITIDVAYRFFATECRRFIVADTPGHEQYTRNMATGACSADLAIVLVDARKGVITQTRRHSCILGLLGVRQVLLAVNKMDLIGFDPAAFAAIAEDYRKLAETLGIAAVTCIPVAARDGDNLFTPSRRTPWYDGPTVMRHLETVEIADEPADQPFRLAVQWVNRPHQDFRGYCGRIAGGAIAVGEPVTVFPSGHGSRVARLFTAAGEQSRARAGQSVTLVLEDEIDVGRGDLLAGGTVAPLVATRLAAHLVWLDDQPMAPGASYVIKLGTGQADATIARLDHRLDIETFQPTAATALAVNEIGAAELALSRPLACETYRQNRELGGFILIDRISHRTVAAGMVDQPLRRASDVPWQALDVDKRFRAGLNRQRPCVLWFTGLSGAGKSTIANLVDRRLAALGRHSCLLDGDNLRNGLNRDLGFGDAARRENIRRVGEVAKLFVEAGLLALVTLISPFRDDRARVRGLLEPGEFIEIHVATSLSECEHRDPKGHYRRARAGALANFTGIDSPYEPPEQPDLRLDTSLLSAEEAAERVVTFLEDGGYI